ncbi:MAG: protein phosphatase 2C domain-containing protein [Myxococcota bacterium]
MRPPLQVAALSHVGMERSLNEDNFRVEGRDDDWILLVCDGMGGHEGGEVASEVASEFILASLRADRTANPTVVIFNALVGANAAVVAEAERRGMPDMGTTAVVARVTGDRCWIGWVGDSRLYQLRDGVRVSGSEDHTRVAEMVRRGILSAPEAKSHPDAHILTQALGGGAGVRDTFKPTSWNEPLELQPRDVLLLCSDGLYDLLSDEEIAALMAGTDPATAAQRLVDAANARGGHDNITVIVALYEADQIPARRTEPASPFLPGTRLTEPPMRPIAPVPEPAAPVPSRSEPPHVPQDPYVSEGTLPDGVAPRPAPRAEVSPMYGRPADEPTVSEAAPRRGSKPARAAVERRVMDLPMLAVLLGAAFGAGMVTMLVVTMALGLTHFGAAEVPARAETTGAEAAGAEAKEPPKPSLGTPAPAEEAPEKEPTAPAPDAAPAPTPSPTP